MSIGTPETRAAALEKFIRENFQVGEDDPYFTHDVSLWDEGYVDSTGLVEVITFIEEEFNVTVTDEMLFSPDFTTIKGMAQMIGDLDPEIQK